MRQVEPGVWRLWVDLESDPVTGRRRQTTRIIRGSRAHAEKERDLLVTAISTGKHVEPGDTTWLEFCATWLEQIRSTIRPATADAYGQKTRMVSRYIGARRMSTITGPMLLSMYRRMLDDGYAPQSVAHAHRLVHRVFKDAIRWRVVDTNPADSADPPRVERSHMSTWTAEQVRMFLERTADDRLAALWRLAAATGMRRGELIGLRWPQINLDRRVLNVSETRVMVGGTPQEARPKTQAGRRRVSIDAGTADALGQWQAAQSKDREFFGDAWAEGEWVWTWEDGRPLSPGWVSKRFRSLTVEHRLPRIRFHDLRHTWATLALEAGVPAKVVADRLGHAGIAITLDTYTHHVDSLDRDAAERVAHLFG